MSLCKKKKPVFWHVWVAQSVSASLFIFISGGRSLRVGGWSSALRGAPAWDSHSQSVPPSLALTQKKKKKKTKSGCQNENPQGISCKSKCGFVA